MRLTGRGVLHDVEEGTALRWRREGQGAGAQEEDGDDSDSEAEEGEDDLEQGPEVGPVMNWVRRRTS